METKQNINDNIWMENGSNCKEEEVKNVKTFIPNY